MIKIRRGLLLLFAFIVSCDSDNGNEGGLNINLVTGIRVVQSQDSPPFTYGNPNILTQGMAVFPNPAIGNFFVQSFNTAEIANVWIIPGSPNKSFNTVDFTHILNSSTYGEDEIESNSILSFNGPNSGSLLIDVTNLDSGYYRVFVKIGDEFYWDNIFIANDNENIQDIEDFWIN